MFHPENFLANLSYMGQGMLGIFAVVGVIILAICLLSALFKGKDETRH